MHLTPRDQRPQRLLAAGVPPLFLKLLEGLSERNDKVRYLVDDVDAPYYYLGTDTVGVPDDWAEVTPVWSGTNGDTWTLLVDSPAGPAFVWFGLEEGEMRNDGATFQVTLAHLVIELYEFADSWPPARIARLAEEELGFRKGTALLEALEKADRSTFAADDAWRAEMLPRLTGPD